MKKVVLFDLDSTLLQMNQDEFLVKYFKLVAKYAAGLGYEPHKFMELFQHAAYAIIKNDGSKTNEDVFWDIMKAQYPEVIELKDKFEKFYETDFKALESIINKNSIPAEIIKELKSKGYTLILATNPLFPKICTYERMRWAGLNPSDFTDITTYEDSRYCKPNHLYYEETLKRNNINPNDCIMVGNDIDDDFSDLPSGIDKVLITDYLINKHNKEITIPKFTLTEFLNYIKENY